MQNAQLMYKSRIIVLDNIVVTMTANVGSTFRLHCLVNSVT